MQALSDVRADASYTIQWMLTTPEVSAWMQRYQIAEGCTVHVVSRCLHGVIIRFQNHRLAIGDEIASRIKVCNA